MRLLKLIVVVCFALVGIAAIQAETRPSKDEAEGRVTLLGTLEEWKYPESKMPEGATMGDGGMPGVYSVKCQTVLTTPDAFDKVVEFYAKKFGTDAVAADGAPLGDPRSVLIQDDAKGRPVKVQVILVNKPKTSTTLVISRADDEKETHIVWAQFMRFDIKR